MYRISILLYTWLNGYMKTPYCFTQWLNLIFFWVTASYGVVHSGCTIFTFLSAMHKGSNFSTTSPMFVIFVFWLIAIRESIKWYLLVDLICISQTIGSIQELFWINKSSLAGESRPHSIASHSLWAHMYPLCLASQSLTFCGYPSSCYPLTLPNRSKKVVGAFHLKKISLPRCR